MRVSAGSEASRNGQNEESKLRQRPTGLLIGKEGVTLFDWNLVPNHRGIDLLSPPPEDARPAPWIATAVRASNDKEARVERNSFV